MPEAIRPPDFSKWILKKHESLWFAKSGPYERRSAHRSDSQDSRWVGYSNFYKDKTGLGDGCAYDIFGKGAVLKLWGLQLKDGDVWDAFAILESGTWRCFSGKEFAPVLIAARHNNDLPHVIISVAIVAAENRQTERNVLEVAVPRGLLGLPPTQ